MIHLYTIEAVTKQSRASVYRKFRQKHRHHPVIASGLKGQHYHSATTPQSFRQQIGKFLEWYQGFSCPPGDTVLLWLSVHGQKTSITFDNGEELDYLQTFGQLHRKVQKDVIVLQHVCWGGYPGITRAMCLPQHGPLMVWGPIIEVDITALHHAEREVLKLLAHTSRPTIQSCRQLVDQINAWGRNNCNYLTDFYRIWYWEDGNASRIPDRYPEPSSMAVRRKAGK